MGNPPLFPAEIREFVAQKYLADVPPRELVAELRDRFNREVSAAQLRQFLSRSGLTERKRQVDRKTCALVSSASANGIARTKAAEPKQILERWAEKAVKLG